VKSLWKKYGHVWIMGYALIYLPWFFYLEQTVTSNYTVMHVALDDYIPFNEYFIVPYLLWFMYVAGAVVYFFFTDKHHYYRLCTFLFIGMTITMVVCTFFPNGTDLRVAVDPDKNLCSRLVVMVQAADTPTNVFPSIHAYNSIGVHSAVMSSAWLREKKGIRIVSLIFMAAVCMSTVFLKQHSVIDVVAAFILGYVMYPLVYGTVWAESRKTSSQNVTG